MALIFEKKPKPFKRKSKPSGDGEIKSLWDFLPMRPSAAFFRGFGVFVLCLPLGYFYAPLTPYYLRFFSSLFDFLFLPLFLPFSIPLMVVLLFFFIAGITRYLASFTSRIRKLKTFNYSQGLLWSGLRHAKLDFPFRYGTSPLFRPNISSSLRSQIFSETSTFAANRAAGYGIEGAITPLEFGATFNTRYEDQAKKFGFRDSPVHYGEYFMSRHWYENFREDEEFSPTIGFYSDLDIVTFDESDLFEYVPLVPESEIVDTGVPMTEEQKKYINEFQDYYERFLLEEKYFEDKGRALLGSLPRAPELGGVDVISDSELPDRFYVYECPFDWDDEKTDPGNRILNNTIKESNNLGPYRTENVDLENIVYRIERQRYPLFNQAHVTNRYRHEADDYSFFQEVRDTRFAQSLLLLKYDEYTLKSYYRIRPVRRIRIKGFLGRGKKPRAFSYSRSVYRCTSPRVFARSKLFEDFLSKGFSDLSYPAKEMKREDSYIGRVGKNLGHNYLFRSSFSSHAYLETFLAMHPYDNEANDYDDTIFEDLSRNFDSQRPYTKRLEDFVQPGDREYNLDYGEYDIPDVFDEDDTLFFTNGGFFSERLLRFRYWNLPHVRTWWWWTEPPCQEDASSVFMVSLPGKPLFNPKTEEEEASYLSPLTSFYPFVENLYELSQKKPIYKEKLLLSFDSLLDKEELKFLRNTARWLILRSRRKQNLCRSRLFNFSTIQDRDLKTYSYKLIRQAPRLIRSMNRARRMLVGFAFRRLYKHVSKLGPVRYRRKPLSFRRFRKLVFRWFFKPAKGKNFSLDYLPSSISDFFMLEVFYYHYFSKFRKIPSWFRLLSIFFAFKKSSAKALSTQGLRMKKGFFSTSYDALVYKAWVSPFFPNSSTKPDDRGWKEFEPYSLASKRAFSGGRYYSSFWDSKSASYLYDKFVLETDTNRIADFYNDGFLFSDFNQASVDSRMARRNFLLKDMDLSLTGYGNRSESGPTNSNRFLDLYISFYRYSQLTRDWFTEYLDWRDKYQSDSVYILYKLAPGEPILDRYLGHKGEDVDKPWKSYSDILTGEYMVDFREYLKASALERKMMEEMNKPDDFPDGERPHPGAIVEVVSEAAADQLPPPDVSKLLFTSFIPKVVKNPNPPFTASDFEQTRLAWQNPDEWDQTEDLMLYQDHSHFKLMPEFDEFQSIFDTRSPKTMSSQELAFPSSRKGFGSVDGFYVFPRILALFPFLSEESASRLAVILFNYMLRERFRRVEGFLPSTFFHAREKYHKKNKPSFNPSLPRALKKGLSSVLSFKEACPALNDFFDTKGVFNGRDWTIYALDAELYNAVTVPHKAALLDCIHCEEDPLEKIRLEESRRILELPVVTRTPFEVAENILDRQRFELSDEFFSTLDLTPTEFEAYVKLKKLFPALSTWSFSRFYSERQKTFSQVLRPLYFFHNSSNFRSYETYYYTRTNSPYMEGGSHHYQFIELIFEQQLDQISFYTEELYSFIEAFGHDLGDIWFLYDEEVPEYNESLLKDAFYAGYTYEFSRWDSLTRLGIVEDLEENLDDVYLSSAKFD